MFHIQVEVQLWPLIKNGLKIFFIGISHSNSQMCRQNLRNFLIKKSIEVLQSKHQNSQVKGILQTLKFLEKIIFEQIQVI